MVSRTTVVTYAATIGVVCVVSGTAVVIRAVVDGATRAAAVHVLLGVVAIASCVRHLSGVSAPTGADDRGVMALGEGGVA